MEKEKNKECNIDYDKTKKRTKNKKKLLVLIVVIVIIIILGGIMTVATLDNDKNIIGTENINQKEETSTIDQMLEEKGYKIKTEYGTLYYPKKWKKQIRIAELDGDFYSVQFYATIKEDEEFHIFDIVFGKAEGVLLGSLDGTNVYLVYGDDSYEKTCTEKELNTIYEMQEDVNYIIGMLKKEEGFTSIL